MPPKTRPLGKPLAWRILLWALVISTLNALAAISYHLYADYQRDLSDLSTHLTFIKDSQTSGLATAAWNFDRPQLEAQLSGLLHTPWLLGAEIQYGVHLDKYIRQGSPVSNGAASRVFPLQIQAGQQLLPVGLLRVETNLAYIHQRTLKRALTTVVTEGIKALVFSALLIWLVHMLVTRRLIRLNRVLQSFRPDSNERLDLLTETDRRANDEISSLAGALVTARDRIQEYRQESQRQRSKLEEEVHKRTEHLDQALLEHQAIFENSLTGIAFLKRQRIQRCNLSFAQMLGYERPEQLLNEDISSIVPHLSTLKGELSSLSTGFNAGLEFSGDVEVGLKSGGRRWFTIQTKPLTTANLDQGLVLTLHDITEKKITAEALKQLTLIDDLTGIANRRALDAELATECRQAARDNSPLSLALIDVDYFKQYNDCYGHAAGDAALQAVASQLQRFCRRPHDIAARYGGEEFVLLLPGCDDPLPLLEELRESILRLGIAHAKSSVANNLTISIGVVTMIGRPEAYQGEHALGEADKRLYLAKSRGRNRVEAIRV